MDKKLDQLFSQAKKEEPLLSLKEVENKIEQAPLPKSFFIKHWPMLVSGFLLFTAGLIYFNVDQKREKEFAQVDLSEPITQSEMNNPIETPIPKVKHNPTEVAANNKISAYNQPAVNFSKSKIDKIKYLELNNEELKTFGIEVNDDTIMVHDVIKDDYILWEVTHGSNSARVFSKDDDFEKSKFKHFRMRHITRSVNGELSKAVKILYADSLNFDYLLPIKIVCDLKAAKIEYFVWYDLTQDFIAALPPRYQDELKTELTNNQKITDESFKEQTNCGYLESFCRDISIFDRIRVFPNPASTHMAAHFETLEACQLTIDLMDIEGRLVQNLFSGSINAGPQRIPLDVAEVKQDLYLLKFEASNGEYETTRVIIKR